MDRAGGEGGPGELAAMRASLRRLPACRECVRAWRRLTGGRLVKDRQRRTLVACSGGADSTALLLCLWAAAGEHVVVGHVVHDMRAAEEGEADAAAVAGLCERLGVPFVRASVRVKDAGGNAEAVGRRLRYRELARMAGQSFCPFLATGHQGDDQVETMLMRLVRGAGPRGLGGIKPTRSLRIGDDALVSVVRPLLTLSRADAEGVCRAAGVAWREDATNADATRWRARLRRDVLPVLRELRGDVARRAAATAAMLHEAADLAEAAAERIVGKADETGDGLSWPREEIAGLGPSVLGNVLRHVRELLVGQRRADRLGARDVETIHRGLRDADRRVREWTVAGMVVRMDRERFSLSRADGLVSRG